MKKIIKKSFISITIISIIIDILLIAFVDLTENEIALLLLMTCIFIPIITWCVYFLYVYPLPDFHNVKAHQCPECLMNCEVFVSAKVHICEHCDNVIFL